MERGRGVVPPVPGSRVFRGRDDLVSRFESIADHRDAFGVKRLRTVPNPSRSGFHRWLQIALVRAAKKAADAALTRRIREIRTESGKTYGAKRITAGLREGGAMVNRKRVERLMRQHGFQGERLKRRHRTPQPGQCQICCGATSPHPPPTGPGPATSPVCRSPAGGFCTWPPSSTCSPVACRTGRWPITCGPSSSPTRPTRLSALVASGWTASSSTAITGLDTGRRHAPTPPRAGRLRTEINYAGHRCMTTGVHDQGGSREVAPVITSA